MPAQPSSKPGAPLYGALLLSGVSILAAAKLWTDRGRNAAAAQADAAQAAARIERLTAETRRLTNLVAALSANLSASNNSYRESLKERGKSAEMQRRAEAKNPPAGGARTPRDAWVFRGYDTPEHAFESLLFNMRVGNLDAMLAGFTPEFRQQTTNNVSREDLAKLAADVKRIKAVNLQTQGAVFLMPVLREDGGQDANASNLLLFKRSDGQWLLDSQYLEDGTQPLQMQLELQQMQMQMLEQAVPAQPDQPAQPQP